MDYNLFIPNGANKKYYEKNEVPFSKKVVYLYLPILLLMFLLLASLPVCTLIYNVINEGEYSILYDFFAIAGMLSFILSIAGIIIVSVFAKSKTIYSMGTFVLIIAIGCVIGLLFWEQIYVTAYDIAINLYSIN